jgi:hypothetical protein
VKIKKTLIQALVLFMLSTSAALAAPVTLIDGTLTAQLNSINGIKANLDKTTGKWYWEVVLDNDIYGVGMIGIAGENPGVTFDSDNTLSYWGNDGHVYYPLSAHTAYGAKFKTGDVIGVALDLTGDAISWYKNGVPQGAQTHLPSSLPGTRLFPILSSGSSGYPTTMTINFGGSPFQFTVPTGYTSYEGESTVTAQTPTSVTATTATLNGTVESLGTTNPTSHGLVWSTTASPTTALGTKTDLGAKTSTGTFSSPITGLVENTTYYVRAYAVNATGTYYGKEISFKTLDITAPAKPAGLGVNPDNGQLNLHWSGNTEPDLDTYKVYKNGIYLATVPKNQTSYTATSLTNSTSYSFSLSAVDISGNESVKSNTASGTPVAPDTTAPAEVTNLTSTHTGTTSTLNWTNPVDADLNRVKIYRYNDATGAWVLIVP